MVKFDADHNKVVGKGLNGMEIIRPDKWLNEVPDAQGNSKFQENTNYLETHPQICTVLMANPAYPYSVGDKIFVHYMAWETAKNGDIVTNEAFIFAEYVFFKILPDGTYLMADNVYIGEQQYTDEVITPSGIFLQGGNVEVSRIKIIHKPNNDNGSIAVGDTVISIDRHDYNFTISGRKFVKLTQKEIVAKIINNKLKPIAN